MSQVSSIHQVSSPITFVLEDDEWRARVGEIAVSIVIDDDGGGRFDYFVFENESVYPCEEGEGCPGHKESEYDANPDACAEACPYSRTEETVSEYQTMFGDDPLAAANAFRDHVKHGTDPCNHRKSWPINAIKIATGDWIIGDRVLKAR